MDQGCCAEQMLQPKDWALNTTKRFWHCTGADLSPSKETNTLARVFLLSQELYCLVTSCHHRFACRDATKPQSESCRLQSATGIYNKHQRATVQMKSKQFESQNLSFLPRDLDPKIRHETAKSKHALFSPTKAAEPFRLPWQPDG